MRMDHQELPPEVRGLRPGDVIVRHGIVNGDLGLILLVSVEPQEHNVVDAWVVLLTGRLRCVTVDLDLEGERWSRVSDRS